MIIVAMLLFGPVSGWLCRTTRQALTVLLLVFGLPLSYWLVQLAALAGGLMLLWLGITLRHRNHRIR